MQEIMTWVVLILTILGTWKILEFIAGFIRDSIIADYEYKSMVKHRGTCDRAIRILSTEEMIQIQQSERRVKISNQC